MTNRLLSILLLVLLLALPCAGFAEVPGPKPGAPVAGVRLDFPGEPPEGLMELIGIHRGDRFSPKKVRESIKLLYLKDVFENIAVESEDTPEGLVLTYHLMPKVRVSGIKVDGNDEISKKNIIAKLALKAGDFMDASLMDKSKEAVRKLYEDEGYRKAEVAIAASKVDGQKSVLHVLIKEGPPAKVREIKITGDLALPEKDVHKRLAVKAGDTLTREDLDKSVNAVTEYYVDKNYVNARVDPPSLKYPDDEALVEFHVQAGPMLVVEFEGNEVSSSKLKKALTFWEDRDISEESVSENLDKLRDFYRREGYYFAVVTSRTEEQISPAKVSVKFIVYEGPRVKLKTISLSGNKELSSDDIHGVMQLEESSFFKSRRVTDEAVAGDVERIRSLYDSRGFLQSEVNSEDLTFNKDKTEAQLKVDINEGPRTYVTTIEVEGGGGVPSEQVLHAIKQEKGKPFNPNQLKEDQDNVLNLFSQRGYIHATLDVLKKFTEDKKGVVLVYRLNPGMPVTVGRIILKGNEHTHDKVLTRELLVHPGDKFDLEKILRSQQKIYKLGFFSQVRIQPVEQEKPEPVKDLLVSVKERNPGLVEFGVGYGEFDLYRGFAEISYRNLFGYGHRVSLRGEASTKEFKGLINYKWPWFLDFRLDFRSSLVYLDAQKVNYKIKDLIASTGFDKTYGEKITASLVYQYERLNLSNVKPGAVLAPEDKKKSNLASITPSAVFDYRDNPFNPTRGSFHGFILKWASTYLGSTVDFAKLTGQTSWYFPLYKGIIFGISGRGGIEGWFSNKLEIPISERFFIGGASNLRGYKLDSVAPKGKKGAPAGGDSMVLFNAEVRFPLPLGFGLVTFIDAGNVWLLNKNVEAARLPQEGTGGLRYGVGVGLRYETPVGPLRLDYGIKLNRLKGESPAELHFTLGQAF